MEKVFLDIETTGLDPTGLDSWEEVVRTTCICAKIDKHRYFKLCSLDEKELLEKFIEWFKTNVTTDSLLIHANGRKFDIPFLLSRICQVCNKELFEEFKNFIEKISQFDMVTDITYKWISLNDICKMYCLPCKNGSGKEAISLWYEGKLDSIEDYCWNDVLLVEKAYSVYMKLFLEK